MRGLPERRLGANKLRSDEEFAIRSVAAAVSGEWRPGENPPDAYLKIGEVTIAVEISTLTQHVSNERGGTHARFSEDVCATNLADRLDRELRDIMLVDRI
jgi:hypothetical protein